MIRPYAVARCIHQTEAILRQQIILSCGFAIPVACLGVVLFYALPFFEERAQGLLSGSVALVRRLPEPKRCLGKVLFYSLAPKILPAEFELLVRVGWLCDIRLVRVCSQCG